MAGLTLPSSPLGLARGRENMRSYPLEGTNKAEILHRLPKRYRFQALGPIQTLALTHALALTQALTLTHALALTQALGRLGGQP